MTTTAPAPDWQFRVLAEGRNGPRAVGAAVLVSPSHALTCAHVVRDAVGTGAGPGSAVLLDAPRADAAWRSGAVVVEDGWWSGDASPWDAAVLGLDAPPPARPAVPGGPWEPGRRVRIVGGPHSPAGWWITATLDGRGGSRPEYAQFTVEPGTPAVVERGYSGSAVRDAEEGTLLGVVAEMAREGRIGWMVPLETVPGIWARAAAAPPRPPGEREVSAAILETARAMSRLRTLILPDARASFHLGLDERLRSWLRPDQDPLSYAHHLVDLAHREYGLVEEVLGQLEVRERGGATMAGVAAAAGPLLGGGR